MQIVPRPAYTPRPTRMLLVCALPGVPPQYFRWVFGPQTPGVEAAKLRDARALAGASSSRERMDILRHAPAPDAPAAGFLSC